MKDNNLKLVHSASGSSKKESTVEEHKLYEILQKLPAPKKEFNLTKDQKKWWYWFGKEFLTTKQLVQLDLIHLKNAAVWMDASNKALSKINKLNESDEDGIKGWVQTFKNGTNNVTGYVTILEKAQKQLDNVSSHFGLSIKDRQKLEASKEDDNQMNWMEEFFGKSKPLKAN